MGHHHRTSSWRLAAGCLLVLAVAPPSPAAARRRTTRRPTTPTRAWPTPTSSSPPDAAAGGLRPAVHDRRRLPDRGCASAAPTRTTARPPATANCPQGFECRVTEVDGTYQSVCLPPVVQVCAPCTTNAECGGGACIPVGGGGDKFCLPGLLRGRVPRRLHLHLGSRRQPPGRVVLRAGELRLPARPGRPGSGPARAPTGSAPATAPRSATRPTAAGRAATRRRRRMRSATAATTTATC